MRLYALCVVVASRETNATCAGSWFTYIQDNVREQLLNPLATNGTNLYASCDTFSCNFMNATWPDCTTETSFVCKAAFTPSGQTPSPIATLKPEPPIQTNVNGNPTVPVIRISVQVVFAGDFQTIFLPGAAAALARMKSAVETAFSNKFKRRFICLNLREGSLVATVATDVPAGSGSGTTNIVKNNLKSLNDDTSTDWISAISNACQSSGGCANGVGAPTVKISTFAETDVAGEQNPPVQAKCGSGCVAGIIIACVAVALIITVATILIVRSTANKGTGQKANEPTEMGTTTASSNAV
jgi:flagellar basal body-associated protein FliL